MLELEIHFPDRGRLSLQGISNSNNEIRANM